MMADWSAFPYDTLGAIVLKLDAIKDRVRFSAVCRSWKFAFLQVKHLSQPTTPWLLLAESKEENPERWRKLFDLCTNRCLELKLPETIGRRCWGSNYGWIVTVDLDREMHLFNPITKARLCLPCQRSLPNPPPDDGTLSDDEWFCKSFVRRAIVLRIHEDEDKDKDKDEDDEFLVMVVFGEWFDLAFARPGDQVWTPLYLYGQTFDEDLYRDRYRETHGVTDVCYWEGKILAILRNGALGHCDITSPNPKFVEEYLPTPPHIFDDGESTLYKLYLVNSFGDLLIVLRNKKEISRYPDYSYETERLDMFRPNFHTKQWEKVNDLGDAVLFLGDNCSVSGIASHLQGNQIYFTDDEAQLWESVFGDEVVGGHDMGAYDMEGQKIVPFYEGSDSRSSFCTPLWFIPKF